MKQGPKTFDLFVANLQPGTDYVPPPTRDSVEAARRRNNPPGTVVLEAQQEGVIITARTLDALNFEDNDQEAFEYFARTMGAVCLKTSWHNYAKYALGQSKKVDQINRRRLQLPIHAEISDENEIAYETRARNEQKLQEELSHVSTIGGLLVHAHRNQLESREYTARKQFGRAIGNAGLRLAATHLVGSRDTPEKLQLAVRDSGREALELSHTIYDGVHPTMAQLSDINSPLSVHLRRSAPTTVHDRIIEQTAYIHEVRSQRNET